jgi:hypothetical protein
MTGELSICEIFKALVLILDRFLLPDTVLPGTGKALRLLKALRFVIYFLKFVRHFVQRPCYRKK